jgi:4-hydroxythreonine-4-phosphate dehydrogenase
MKPKIGLVMGDPAGVGPELMAKLLADAGIRDRADILVIGDRRVLARGEDAAAVALDLAIVTERAQAVPSGPRPTFLDRRDLDPTEAPVGKITAKGGASAIGNYSLALDLARAGVIDGITFVPFNKEAIRSALGTYEDEVVYASEALGVTTTCCEFNVIEGLWNARVTSHVPLKGVAELITQERILERLRLTIEALQRAGIAAPRIGVAALNPHAGDGGAFGREEIDVIGPAVEAAKRQGLDADGPYPSDTVFLRAKKGQFDAVLTMYHDQGQIAIKLLGFDQGVTVIGGLPFPITTPAHGTAYDIAGQGIANLEPTRRAFEIACRMAESERLRKVA